MNSSRSDFLSLSSNFSSRSTTSSTSNSSSSSSSSSRSSPPALRDYNPYADGEMMYNGSSNNTNTHFPKGLPVIVLDYLDGDVNPFVSSDKKAIPAEARQHLMLFGRKHHELISTDVSKVAELILKGEEKEIEEVLKLVKQNPSLLYRQAKAKDPLGREVQGTPLQIAAMAGDVDLKAEIKEEKDRGAVERLITAANLSPEEVREQLTVITSEEAKQKNAARNKRVVDTIKKFGESIIEKAKEYKGDNFKEFQTQCQSVIDQLENDLKAGMNEVITSGYIFDPKILQEAAEWFEENVGRFGGWWSNQSDVFWANGFGKLQSKLSSRDAQVIRAGIGNLVDDGKIPARTLNNSNSVSFFFTSAPRLGVDFYLGRVGGLCGSRAGVPCGRIGRAVAMLANLCQAKTRALQNLCNTQTIGQRLHA